eukprot:4854222-Pleurochrysis_carterae.AAC.2
MAVVSRGVGAAAARRDEHKPAAHVLALRVPTSRFAHSPAHSLNLALSFYARVPIVRFWSPRVDSSPRVPIVRFWSSVSPPALSLPVCLASPAPCN